MFSIFSGSITPSVFFLVDRLTGRSAKLITLFFNFIGFFEWSFRGSFLENYFNFEFALNLILSSDFSGIGRLRNLAGFSEINSRRFRAGGYFILRAFFGWIYKKTNGIWKKVGPLTSSVFSASTGGFVHPKLPLEYSYVFKLLFHLLEVKMGQKASLQQWQLSSSGQTLK